MSGYHINEIPKGVLGESSKILEEVLEVQDAEKQGARIMVLLELSDLLGAVMCYLERNYPDMKMDDLYIMNNITTRAFRSGQRK